METQLATKKLQNKIDPKFTIFSFFLPITGTCLCNIPLFLSSSCLPSQSLSLRRKKKKKSLLKVLRGVNCGMELSINERFFLKQTIFYSSRLDAHSTGHWPVCYQVPDLYPSAFQTSFQDEWNGSIIIIVVCFILKLPTQEATQHLSMANIAVLEITWMCCEKYIDYGVGLETHFYLQSLKYSLT